VPLTPRCPIIKVKRFRAPGRVSAQLGFRRPSRLKARLANNEIVENARTKPKSIWATQEMYAGYPVRDLRREWLEGLAIEKCENEAKVNLGNMEYARQFFGRDHPRCAIFCADHLKI
jgi:hypothetical protein